MGPKRRRLRENGHRLRVESVFLVLNCVANSSMHAGGKARQERSEVRRAAIAGKGGFLVLARAQFADSQ